MVIVDFAPDFVAGQEMTNRKPFLNDYLKHCREDMHGFTEHVLVKGRLHMWTLDVGDNHNKECKEYEETMKLFLRSDRLI